MANNFWGKFGQRTNKTQVTTCKDPETFFDLFLDGERDIHRILPAGEQMIDVYHLFKEDVGELGTNTNIFVAAFTTAHARVKLYQDGCFPCTPASCTWTPIPWCTWPPKALSVFVSELSLYLHI